MLSKLKFWSSSDPAEQLVEGLINVKGNHDAVALLPYDDGTFYLKPCNFDKDLIGGQGGYETEDGDKIVLDGDGQPVRDLFGVPMLLAVDPTEHAAAVDPIKALVAQKNNIGEWIRVDKSGSILEVGDAVAPASEMSDEASDDVDIGLEGSMVEQELNERGIGLEQATPSQIEAVMKELAERGDLTKIYDIAPPAAPAVADGGDLVLDEATHIAVDQSKATDLVPKTTSTTELNTALDKARMEEHDEDKWKSIFIQGMIAGAVTAAVAGLVFVGVFALIG